MRGEENIMTKFYVANLGRGNLEAIREEFVSTNEKGLYTYYVDDWMQTVYEYFEDYTLYEAEHIVDVSDTAITEDVHFELNNPFLLNEKQLWRINDNKYLMMYSAYQLGKTERYVVQVLTSNKVNELFEKIKFNYKVSA